MKTNFPINPHSVGKNAFSLVELLVAVALMTVIIVGLYSMFNETQRALRTNVSQVDVLESGRSAIELIVQDIQQAEAPGPLRQAPAKSILFPPPYKITNVYAITNRSPHFWSGIQTNRSQPYFTNPMIQNLADDTKRINILQEVFFLTRSNLNWVAKGYFVSPSRINAVSPNAPATISYGTLFRFSSPNVIVDPIDPDRDRTLSNSRRMRSDSFLALWEVYRGSKSKIRGNYRLTESNRRRVNLTFPLIDGVVHFKMQPVDSLGQPMRYWTNNPTAGRSDRKLHSRYPSVVLKPEEVSLPGGVPVAETRSAFYDYALPAYVELEIGILDPATLEKVKSMEGNPELVQDFLGQQASNVHLFRRMVRLPLAPKIIPKTMSRK